MKKIFVLILMYSSLSMAQSLPYQPAGDLSRPAEIANGVCFYQDQYFDRSGISYNQNAGVRVALELKLFANSASQRQNEALENITNSCIGEIVRNSKAMCAYDSVASIWYTAKSVASNAPRFTYTTKLGYQCRSGQAVRIYPSPGVPATTVGASF